VRCHQELNLRPTNPKLCDDEDGIQLPTRFDDRFVGGVSINDLKPKLNCFSHSVLTAHPATASNLRPFLWVSVSQVGFQPKVRVGAVVIGGDLTMFVFHERRRDCYCYCYCYCNVTRSVLNSLSRTGRRRYGRCLLLLPLLRTDSFLLAVVVTGEVTPGHSPCHSYCCSLSSNLVLDGGLTCLDYFLAH
jgi:hypothetical protein